MTPNKPTAPWVSIGLGVLLALSTLIAWGSRGNYASAADLANVRIDVAKHDAQIQDERRTLETMARQIDDLHKLLIQGKIPGNGNK